MKLVDDAEKTTVTLVYILHHAVLRESSKTTKLRVIFNALFKTRDRPSLNDYLVIGPKLQTDRDNITLVMW